jgi:hypothetical protein
MAPNYKDSKIYILKSEQEKKHYIGATTKRLCQRLAQHNDYYSKYLNNECPFDESFEILKYSDVRIQLLESVHVNSKDELNKKLDEYLENQKDKIVNKTEKKVKVRKTKPKKEIIKIVEEKTPVSSKEESKSDEETKSTESKESFKSYTKEDLKQIEEEKKKELTNPKFLNRLQALRNNLIK